MKTRQTAAKSQSVFFKFWNTVFMALLLCDGMGGTDG